MIQAPTSGHSCLVRSLAVLQRWRTRFPPMWPALDSHCLRHMRVEFVGSLLYTERFSPGTLVSPLLKNQHLSCSVLIFSLQCPQLALERLDT